MVDGRYKFPFFFVFFFSGFLFFVRESVVAT